MPRSRPEKTPPLRQPGPPLDPGKERWPLAPHLEALIKAVGYETVPAAATAFNIPPKVLRRYLTGERWPSNHTLRGILRVLGASLEDLTSARDGTPEKNPRKSGRVV